MNNITVAGQLGKDSELKQIGQDTVLSFSVADSQGREKPTIWWNCQLWGKRAISLEQYLTKGQSVTISGSVSQRSYKDKQKGQEKFAQEIRVNELALQGGKREEAPRQAASKAAPSKGFDDLEDDFIPF